MAQDQKKLIKKMGMKPTKERLRLSCYQLPAGHLKNLATWLRSIISAMRCTGIITKRMRCRLTKKPGQRLRKCREGKGLYNKGVALQNNNKLPECIHAYKQALKLDPTDEDARQNLQRALKQQNSRRKKDNKEKQRKRSPGRSETKGKKKTKPQEQKNNPNHSQRSANKTRKRKRRSCNRKKNLRINYNG